MAGFFSWHYPYFVLLFIGKQMFFRKFKVLNYKGYRYGGIFDFRYIGTGFGGWGFVTRLTAGGFTDVARPERRAFHPMKNR